MPRGLSAADPRFLVPPVDQSGADCLRFLQQQPLVTSYRFTVSINEAEMEFLTLQFAQTRLDRKIRLSPFAGATESRVSSQTKSQLHSQLRK